MPVVVVRLGITVDKVFPSCQIHAFQVLVVGGDARIDDAGNYTVSVQALAGWLNEGVVGCMTLQRHFTGAHQDGAIAQHHRGKIACGKNEGDSQSETDDQFDETNIGLVISRVSKENGR